MTNCRHIQFVASAGTGKTHQVVNLYQALLFGRPYPATATDLPGVEPGAVFDGRNRVPPEQIIMLTFTKNAAAEMRSRVTAAIEQELAGGHPDNEAFCWSLLRRLSSAAIATVHSFAQQILATHTLHLGLSPELKVIEETDASDLRMEAIEAALKTALGSSAPAYVADLEMLCQGRGVRNVEGGIARCIALCHAWGIDLAQSRPEALIKPPIPPGLRDLQELKQRLDDAAWQKSKKLQEVTLAVSDAIRKIRHGAQTDAAVIGDLVAGCAGDIRLTTKGAWGRSEDIMTLKQATESTLDTLASYPEQVEATRLLTSFLTLARDSVIRIQNRKRTLGVLDFDDLLFKARDLIRSRPTAVPPTAVIIVDEAQDNSRLQNELIRLIQSTSGASLILCGDTKQTIYGWRGADPDGLPQFAEAMQLAAIPLRTSYRSQKGILDWVNDIFAGVVFGPGRYGKDETLLPCPAAEPLTGPAVELLLPPWEATPDPAAIIALPKSKSTTRVALCRNDLRKLAKEDSDDPQWQAALDQQEQAVAMEARAVARRIRLLTAAPPAGNWHPDRTWDPNRGKWAPARPAAYRYRDILILLRAGSRQEVYEQALQEEGIPFTTNGKGRGFFARQETLDISNLLSWLAFPNDRLAWLGLLRSPFVALSDNAIALLELAHATGSIPSPEEPLFAADSIAALRHHNLTADADALQRAAPLLERLRRLCGRVNAVDLVREAVRHTGYDAILAGTFHGVQRLANLQKLMTWLQDRERDETLNLQETARRLANEIAGGRETPDAAVLDPDDDSVRINTIHAAKGLSSPVVIIPDLRRQPRNDSDWILVVRDTGGAASGLAAKLRRFAGDDTADSPSAGFAEAADRNKSDRDQESRRLFYVACTRARDLLILSGENPFNGSAESWRSWINRHLLHCNFDQRLITLRPYAEVERAWRGMAAPPPALPIPEPRLLDSVASAQPRYPTPERYRFPVTTLTHPCLLALTAGHNPSGIGSRATGKMPLADIRLSLAQTAITTASAEFSETPEPVEDRARIGTLAHRILESLDYNASIPLESQIAASAEWNDSPRSDRARLQKQVLSAANAIAALLPDHQPSTINQAYGAASHSPILHEFPFAARFDDDGAQVIVDGKVDLLFLKDGCWHLVDYKFSDHSPDELRERYGAQLLVYREALSLPTKAPGLRTPKFACANPAPAEWTLTILAVDSAGRCALVPIEGDPPADLPALLIDAARQLQHP